MAGQSPILNITQMISSVFLYCCLVCYPTLAAMHFKTPRFSGDQGLWPNHKRIMRCFDETAQAVHSWPRWMEWSEGWGRGGWGAAVLKRGDSEPRAHLRAPSVPFVKVLMGRNPRARILLAAPPTGYAHTLTSVCHTQWHKPQQT